MIIVELWVRLSRKGFRGGNSGGEGCKKLSCYRNNNIDMKYFKYPTGEGVGEEHELNREGKRSLSRGKVRGRLNVT